MHHLILIQKPSQRAILNLNSQIRDLDGRGGGGKMNGRYRHQEEAELALPESMG